METRGASSPGILVLTTGLSRPFMRLDKYPTLLKELERHMEVLLVACCRSGALRPRQGSSPSVSEAGTDRSVFAKVFNLKDFQNDFVKWCCLVPLPLQNYMSSLISVTHGCC